MSLPGFRINDCVTSPPLQTVFSHRFFPDRFILFCITPRKGQPNPMWHVKNFFKTLFTLISYYKPPINHCPLWSYTILVIQYMYMFVAIGQVELNPFRSNFEQQKKLLLLLSSVVIFRKICLTYDFI